jgi:hypothetical protein
MSNVGEDDVEVEEKNQKPRSPFGGKSDGGWASNEADRNGSHQ